MKDKLDRLIRLIGSDGGFYVLALHSFIEFFMKNNFPFYDDSWTVNFNTNFYNYKKYLIERNPGKYLNELVSFKSIMDQDKLINLILHDFQEMSVEEVRASTFNFLQFSKVVGIDENLLTELKKSLDYWERKNSRSDDLAELESVKNELFRLKLENDHLLKEYREFEEMKTVKKYLESRIETMSLEIEMQKQSSKEQIQVLGEITEEKQNIEQKISKYENIDRYLKNLLRVSLYSRTRMDYERSLTELTSEQKEVLESISLKTDFLVKGGAGTGKTLILLEAMRSANSGTLAFASKKILLLTYTNTLVKYDRYISDIMKIDQSESSINTADTFLNGVFENLYPEIEINYSIIDQLCSDYNKTSFFDDKQLKMEIEDYIFGYRITENEYIGKMIQRKGMRIKLNKIQRKEVWAIKCKIEESMLDQKVISKAFSRNFLYEIEHELVYDHIFIDESQDLYPIELKLLKKLSRSSLVMAGDTDQSIYGIGAPYQRANISSGGSTRVLKMNFRNTIPIHNLAEKFRKKTATEYDKMIAPMAFREGPIPELYTSEVEDELYNLLIEKVKIFINTIEYDPENICILAPSAKLLNKIEEKLNENGMFSVKIKDPDFSFKSEGSIRLSPLHSSKGLDIPVVLLFIPLLYYNRELEKKEREVLVRNLIYVSMTRAMENLNIFTIEKSEDEVINDLIKIM